MVRDERLTESDAGQGRRAIDFNAEPAPEDPWEEFEWALGAEASLSDSLKAELQAARACLEPNWDA